jgi:hypothetical protein
MLSVYSTSGNEAVPCQANYLRGLLVNCLPGMNNLLFAFTDEWSKYNISERLNAVTE